MLLLPFQPYFHISNMLGSADVLITLLEEDAGTFSVPSKVLTYMCAERAQLAAMPKQNLATKTIQGNNLGIVTDPDNQRAFIEAAKKIYTYEEKRKQMALNGRKYAEANFDIELICNKFEKIFTEIET